MQRLAGGVRGGSRRTPSSDFPENTHRKWCLLGPYRHMVVPPTLVRQIRQPQAQQPAAGGKGAAPNGRQQSSARNAARDLATFATEQLRAVEAWPQGKAMARRRRRRVPSVFSLLSRLCWQLHHVSLPLLFYWR